MKKIVLMFILVSVLGIKLIDILSTDADYTDVEEDEIPNIGNF